MPYTDEDLALEEGLKRMDLGNSLIIRCFAQWMISVNGSISQTCAHDSLRFSLVLQQPKLPLAILIIFELSY